MNELYSVVDILSDVIILVITFLFVTIITGMVLFYLHLNKPFKNEKTKTTEEDQFPTPNV